MVLNDTISQYPPLKIGPAPREGQVQYKLVNSAFMVNISPRMTQNTKNLDVLFFVTAMMFFYATFSRSKCRNIFLELQKKSRIYLLKIRFATDFHHFTACRMAECQLFGMEVKTIGRLSVEGVAGNGTVHAIGMGGVDAQLVGATGFGPVGDAGFRFACEDIQHFVAGDGGLAPLEIDHLQGAVVVVRTEGKADKSFRLLACGDSVEQGDVALLYLPCLELLLQTGMDILFFGDEQQAGSVHVEAMDQ